jgi:hypothetical protein
MVSVSLQGGVEIDLLSGSEFKDGLGNLGKELRRNPPNRLTIPASLQGSGSGADNALRFGGPTIHRVWQLKGLSIVGNNALSGPIAVSTTGTAANTANVSLPAGASLTGFDIEFGAGAAAVSGIATVALTASGTLKYQVTASATNGSSLEVRYPQPLPAFNPTSSITITVPAIVGGSDYTITAYGTSLVALYQGDPIISTPTNILLPATPIPGAPTFQNDALWVKPGDTVFAILFGAGATENYSGQLHVAEYISNQALANCL